MTSNTDKPSTAEIVEAFKPLSLRQKIHLLSIDGSIFDQEFQKMEFLDQLFIFYYHAIIWVQCSQSTFDIFILWENHMLYDFSLINNYLLSIICYKWHFLELISKYDIL